MAIVERFMFGLSAGKSGRSREVAVIGGSTVFGSEAWGNKQKKCFLQASEPSMNLNISWSLNFLTPSDSLKPLN